MDMNSKNPAVRKDVTIKGVSVPALGLGTWDLRGEDCVVGVQHALTVGYRHVDTAQGYDNETEVGRGLKASGVARDEVFVTTKVKPENFTRDKVLSSTRASLQKLGTDYVDLLLLHWPNPEVSLEETFAALLELHDAGAAKHLGVSNFPPALVEEAMKYGPVFCNQVEYHPYLSQDKLLAQAERADYLLTAYSPLAQGKVLDDAVLKAIGVRHDKSVAQVVLRWLLQQGHVAAIPKAATEEHREANFDVFDFELSDDEMEAVFDLGRDERLVDPEDGPDWER